jgi:mono/diheme cytochrome c family protein
MTLRVRILAVVAAIVVATLAIGVWVFHGPGPLAFAGGRKVALADYRSANPTGVPAALAQASLVERGEYLTKAADCTACHTKPDGQKYGGGLAFNLPFGTLYSTNITPDKETGIGDYSDQDFLNAVQRGIRRDGARLYPAMPSTSYSYMTAADVLAIKAYLFSLSPVHSRAPVNTLGFPYNQRWAMTFWWVVFNPDQRFEPDTSKTPEWNRGAYLGEALAHCGECHTPRNFVFALDNRQKFAGAVSAGWHAYNITSYKKTGIGAWSDDDLFSYLSTGQADHHGTASGPMGEAVDRSFSQMAPDDIRAIIAYLRSVPAIASPDTPAILTSPAPASPDQGGGAGDTRGKMVFEGACVSCHGWRGESPVSPFATLTGAEAVNDPSATNVVQIVISGTQRETPQDVLSMPSFGRIYSDAEIAAVTNYVTARFGRAGSHITSKEVAALRHRPAP